MKTLNKLSREEDNYNGFVSKLGLYEEKRQQLQAMRKEEYNKFIAQKESKSPNNNNTTATNNNMIDNINNNNLSNINNNINNNFNNNNNNRARAGDQLSNETATRSSSSSRPTYEDILQRKRLEEQNYRQNSNLNLLDASTTAAYPTLNNKNNNNSNNNNKMISNMNNGPTQEPVKPDLIRHDPINISSPSKVVVHPYQTAATAPHPNKFAATEPATLMIGKELSAEENYRKKEQYRLELFKQMKEKQQNKLNRENAPQVAQQNFHDNDVANNNNLNNKNNNNSYNNFDFPTKPNDINATPYNNFDSFNNNNNNTLLENNNFHYTNRFNANNINNNNNPLSEQALQQQLQLMNLYRMYNNNNNPNNINFHNNNIPSTLYSNPIPLLSSDLSLLTTNPYVNPYTTNLILPPPPLPPPPPNPLYIPNNNNNLSPLSLYTNQLLDDRYQTLQALLSRYSHDVRDQNSGQTLNDNNNNNNNNYIKNDAPNNNNNNKNHGDVGNKINHNNNNNNNSANKNFNKKAAGMFVDNNIDEENLINRKKMYQKELQKQIEEDRLMKLRKKQEEEEYDRKMMAEMNRYNDLKKKVGGSGAPLLDQFGNVISGDEQTLRKVSQSVLYNDLNNSPSHKEAAQDTRTNQLFNNQSTVSQPLINQSPLHSKVVNQSSTGGQSPGIHSPTNLSPTHNFSHARGGNGIFGEPMSDEQKKSKTKYQEDLRRQIEEKKEREKEERERKRLEDEMLIRKVEEDNLRLQMEFEEEKKKLKERKEEEERRRLEEIERKEKLKKQKIEEEQQRALRLQQQENEMRERQSREKQLQDKGQKESNEKEQIQQQRDLLEEPQKLPPRPNSKPPSARRANKKKNGDRTRENTFHIDQNNDGDEANEASTPTARNHDNVVAAAGYSHRKPTSPPVPALRNQMRHDSVKTNPELLDQLAEMRKQLDRKKMNADKLIQQIKYQDRDINAPSSQPLSRPPTGPSRRSNHNHPIHTQPHHNQANFNQPNNFTDDSPTNKHPINNAIKQKQKQPLQQKYDDNVPVKSRQYELINSSNNFNDDDNFVRKSSEKDFNSSPKASKALLDPVKVADSGNKMLKNSRNEPDMRKIRQRNVDDDYNDSGDDEEDEDDEDEDGDSENDAKVLRLTYSANHFPDLQKAINTERRQQGKKDQQQSFNSSYKSNKNNNNVRKIQPATPPALDEDEYEEDEDDDEDNDDEDNDDDNDDGEDTFDDEMLDELIRKKQQADMELRRTMKSPPQSSKDNRNSRSRKKNDDEEDEDVSGVHLKNKRMFINDKFQEIDERPLSKSSLNPEELKRHNEDRLKKLKDLAGETSDDSEALMDSFIEKKKQSRGKVSAEEYWMRPSSKY